MDQPPTPAKLAARRIWIHNASDATDAPDISATAVLLFARLRSELGRWIGSVGYQTLLERALGMAREGHPWLGSLSSAGEYEPVITAPVQRLGAVEATEGILAVLEKLVDLLSSVVGPRIALRLIEQAASLQVPEAMSNNQEPEQ